VAKKAAKQMPELEMRFAVFWAHSAAITSNQPENTMAHTADFDELAGRINGIGQPSMTMRPFGIATSSCFPVQKTTCW
jgi:hypothetical protein